VAVQSNVVYLTPANCRAIGKHLCGVR